MIFLIQTLSLGMDLAWWALLIVFLVAACGLYPLPGFRWIAGHFCVALVTVPVGQWLFLPFQKPAGSTISGAFGVAGFWTFLISAAADFIVLVLALSEISSLISKAYPETRSVIIRSLLRAHGYVRHLGFSAVALALAYPIPAVIYRLTHGTATA
jgi:hypothetical protein